jgi:hypothetical protein
LAIAAIFGFVICLWLGWAFYGAPYFAQQFGTTGKDDFIPTLGQVGDLFGGINALFAAFAFAGVAIAAYFQYQSLRITRDQRNEASEALALSKEQFTRQSFEPLLFKLLELNVIPERMHQATLISNSGSAWLDLDEASNGLRHAFNLRVAQGTEPPLAFDLTKKEFDNFYRKNEHKLAPYFRRTYQLFNLINECALPNSSKYTYARIVRSNISSNELLMLMFDRACRRAGAFQLLADEFNLLKYVNHDEALDHLLHQEIHILQ